jgi:hypothetical protein
MSYYTHDGTIPDLNYDYHTIKVDTYGQVSKNNFKTYLMTPLNNVVQARLMATHIHTLDTNEHIYISIEELESGQILNERASNVITGQNSSLSNVQNIFGSMVSMSQPATNHGNNPVDYHHIFKNEYPIISQFFPALQNISTLTVKFYGADGNLMVPGTTEEENHLILQIICRKTIT